jgi:hypothetical protein
MKRPTLTLTTPKSNGLRPKKKMLKTLTSVPPHSRSPVHQLKPSTS